jgi:hypothetical protein
MVKEIMQALCSASASHRDAGCKQSAWLEEMCPHGQGTVLDVACPADFVWRDSAQDIQLELF